MCSVTLLLAVCVLDVIVAESADDAQFAVGSIQLGLCALPTMWTFARRSDLVKECLACLVAAAEAIEPHADAEAQGHVRAAVRADRMRVSVYLLAATTPLIILTDVKVRSESRWLQAAVLLWTGYSYVAMCFAYYTLMLLAFVANSSLAQLYRVVGRGVESGRCRRRWAAMQGRLLRVSLVMDAFLPGLLPFVMVGSVILPAFSTASVLADPARADLMSVVAMPDLWFVFVPLCESGASLSAARGRVAECAYRGPWLEEPPHRRPPAWGSWASTLVLDRHALLGVLKSWFSYVQAMSSMRRRQGLQGWQG
ncbi:hypothetical protein ONE63_000225 [Megalurothrips usitatus]|uniref:G protein-coupled receptor n=1 Tax=Megalurothrips usitatus TaxID=439358 RepID=A0AAV7XYU9_9NEOP|nr:hypothetical protein ONE63_000225 [Megalurothrips usitatus]